MIEINDFALLLLLLLFCLHLPVTYSVGKRPALENCITDK